MVLEQLDSLRCGCLLLIAIKICLALQSALAFMGELLVALLEQVLWQELEQE